MKKKEVGFAFLRWDYYTSCWKQFLPALATDLLTASSCVRNGNVLGLKMFNVLCKANLKMWLVACSNQYESMGGSCGLALCLSPDLFPHAKFSWLLLSCPNTTFQNNCFRPTTFSIIQRPKFANRALWFPHDSYYEHLAIFTGIPAILIHRHSNSIKTAW